MLTGINHINIVVENIQPTVDFFVKNFGFTASPPQVLTGAWVDQLTGYKNASATHVALAPPAGSMSSSLEILRYDHPNSPQVHHTPGLNACGFRHLGFNVDDIEANVASLKAQGVHFFSDIVTVPGMNLKTVYFYGPENIILQLEQVVVTA